MRVYIARQAIYDRSKKIYAYELLYRSGPVNAYDPSIDGDRATRSLLSYAFTAFGLSSITDNKPAYINFTEKLLREEFPRVLDPEDVVIEILENVPPSQENIEALQRLKGAGFCLALDDYDGSAHFDKILPFVTVVKVDFQLVKGLKRYAIAEKLKILGIQSLAEKIETDEDYRDAWNGGYAYFQGYYFTRPAVMSKSFSSVASATHMRVLQELNRPSMDFDSMAKIIRADISLSYKVLHRINTLEYYRGHRVVPLKDALIRMGVMEIRRWMTLLLVHDTISREETEIVRLALIRGTFAENIMFQLGERSLCEDAFSTGMFSLISALYGDDLDTLLNDICISNKVKDALQGKQGALRDILNFVIAYEHGEWQAAYAIMDGKIDMTWAADCYLEAIRYSDQAFLECKEFE